MLILVTFVELASRVHQHVVSVCKLCLNFWRILVIVITTASAILQAAYGSRQIKVVCNRHPCDCHRISHQIYQHLVAVGISKIVFQCFFSTFVSAIYASLCCRVRSVRLSFIPKVLADSCISAKLTPTDVSVRFKTADQCNNNAAWLHDFHFHDRTQASHTNSERYFVCFFAVELLRISNRACSIVGRWYHFVRPFWLDIPRTTVDGTN